MDISLSIFHCPYSTVHIPIPIANKLSQKSDPPSSQPKRHVFVRVALFHESRILSTVHFVELNQTDAQNRQDITILQDLIQKLADFHESGLHHGDGTSGYPPLSHVIGRSHPGALCALLSPLLQGNCKSYLLASFAESQLTEGQEKDVLKILEVFERMSGCLTTTGRRVYVENIQVGVDCFFGWVFFLIFFELF